VHYCPVEAIIIDDNEIYVDQNLCVDCGVCVRSGACKVEALYLPETPWPRSIRAAFSGGGLSFFLPGKRYHPDGRRRYERLEMKMPLPRMSFQEVKEKRVGFGSRGTSEMKSNDRTGRFKDGEAGVACEMGRPGISFCFKDLEKVSVALVRAGVEIEPENPVSVMLDLKTGEINKGFKEIMEERALSAIIECKVPMEKIPEIYVTLQRVAGEINTVFSLDLINKCRKGRPPLKNMLDGAGVSVRINGKTNLGLGRPLIK
jgi:hypothetical protein